jgi:hypothetical protein
MSEDRLISFELVRSNWDRGFEVFFDLLFWGLGTWMGVIALLQFVLLPAWTPPQRSVPAAIVAIVVAPLMMARRWFYQFHAVSATAEEIDLRRTVGTITLPATEVVGLLAQSGFNWKQSDNLEDDVKRLVSWRKLVILTEHGRHTLPFEAEDCPQIYKALRLFCPAAWGIPYPGNLEAPQLGTKAWTVPLPNPQTTTHPGSVPVFVHERLRSLKRIRRFYRLQSGKNAIIGIALLIGCTWLSFKIVASFFTDHPFQPDANVIIYLTMFIVAGVVFLKDVPRDLRILGQLRREIVKSRT